MAKGVAMPIIRATCPTCGDVELTPRDLKVMVCSTNGEATYGFRCPGCKFLVSKKTDKQVVEVLVSSGVSMSFWRLPAELNESHDGEPINYDDLIDFHYLINSDDWIIRLRDELNEVGKDIES